jgi:hypothetical protein
VVAPLDIDALRHERGRRSGHDMRAHLRSEAHAYLATGRLEPAGGAAEGYTLAAIEQRIRAAKARLDE